MTPNNPTPPESALSVTVAFSPCRKVLLPRKKSSKPHKSMDDLDKTNFQEKCAGNKNIAGNPEQSAEAVIMQNRVSQALQKVSPRERSVFVMRHYNELKTREIAEILNVSQGTVKALLFRAIRKLRKELSFYLGNPGLEATYE